MSINNMRLSANITNKTLASNRSKVNINSTDQNNANNSKRHRSQESSLINQENKITGKNSNYQDRGQVIKTIEMFDKIKKLISPDKHPKETLIKSNTNSTNSTKQGFNKCFGNKNNGSKSTSNDKIKLINKINEGKKALHYQVKDNKISDYKFIPCNTDENNEDESFDDLDQTFKNSRIIDDFYTNSIAEADCSISDETGPSKLINKLPSQFVKQEAILKTNTINTTNNTKNSITNTSNTTNNNNVKNIINQPITKPSTPNKNDKLNEISISDSYDFARLNKQKREVKNHYIYNDYLNFAKRDINYQNEEGWGAIHYACDEGNFKIIDILIEKKANLNLMIIKDKMKKSPLHISCGRGYFDITRQLIENGANPLIVDEECNSLIHICTAKGHVELLKYLLEKNLQIDIYNSLGYTPYHLTQSEKILELLHESLKNNNQCDKVKIHTTNDKSVNHLLNHMKHASLYNNKKYTESLLNNNVYPLVTKGSDSSSHNSNTSLFNIPIRKNCKLEETSKTTKIPHNYKPPIPNNDKNSKNPHTSRNMGNLDLTSATMTMNDHKNIQTLNNELLSSDISSMDEMKSNSENDSSTTPYSQDEERIGPSSFVCHALLGKGSFGEVYLVEKKSNKTLYAMKVLSKNRIMSNNHVKYAMTEKSVLSVTNHPFIVKLIYSFQTSDKLFLILEYCPGGDLAGRLKAEKKFSEEVSKIYLCEIILALEDLHQKDIIFRDLKPDNIVIDKEGHVLLTDFGLSKEGVLDNEGAKSFCGSPAYLAPEMLKRSGHGKAVDWYILGVLFYEMLVGYPPFYGSNKDQLYKNIENSELRIPKFVSDGAASLIVSLLQKDPNQRLGTKQDAEDVKNHPYFKSVNWKNVLDRKLKPPVPKNSKVVTNQKPKEFGDNLFDDGTNQFDGWSFIKPEDEI